MTRKLVLAGDAGGTKTNLALFDAAKGPLQPLRAARFATQEVASLEGMVEEFLAGEIVYAAAFGVAGAVHDGFADMVNIDWHADQRKLSAVLGGAPVELMNDLVAMAWGVVAIPSDRFVVLRAGKPRPGGNRVLIAAGTGLGEALMINHEDRWLPIASEGGHADFAPRSELEAELWRYLYERVGHVSYERVLSGPGLVNIHRFLHEARGEREDPELAARIDGEEGGKAITTSALAGSSAVCGKTVDLFLRIYGAEAGNLALTGLAMGGVYIGGGIAPAMLPLMQGPAFVEGFMAKGRIKEIIAEIPIKVINEPEAPMFGAALRAIQLLEKK